MNRDEEVLNYYDYTINRNPDNAYNNEVKVQKLQEIKRNSLRLGDQQS
ncbi:unnamed protein product [Paramecium sonneborni]|uniref:Uncharacterized protein n=1 Tax=Paramecium sonneborni TaxID=65129 RepID=A0A8S1R944_9CILI|nr:unnamed protein product [Paramecium sonneborni]